MTKHKRNAQITDSFMTRVRTLVKLHTTIQQQRHKKEVLDEVVFDTQKELKTLQKKVAHYQTIYEGFIPLQAVPTAAENSKRDSLKKELTRLQTLVAGQQEALTEKAYSNPVTLLSKPTLQKTLNPRKMLRWYKKYRKEKKEFTDAVNKARSADVHFLLEKEQAKVKVANNGTRHYKPDFLFSKSNHIEVEDKLISTYYLSDIPAYLSPYVLFKLLTSSLPFSISVFIEPTVSSSLIKKARQRVSILEMQQNDRVHKGKLRDQQLEKSIEEITSFIEELVHETEKGVIYSFYLSLQGKDKEELKKLHKELKNITDAIEFSLTRYIYSQKKAFETMLPFNQDLIKHNRILQSTAASYLIPFVTKQIHDPDGVFLGIHAYHDSLVLLNPFTVRNSNVNILGVSGAGKSVTAKVLATRLYMRGTQIIIIDPEGEYVDFAKALGGEVIQFSRENGINPFSLPTKDEGEMLDHIAVLKTFFKFFIPEDKYDSAVLDKALVQVFKKKNATFTSFLSLLKKDPMFEYINVLQEGSLKGIFTSERELQLDNDLLVFDISPLGDTEKKAPAMYLLTSLIWQLVNKKTDRKRMLFIDEAHKLLVDRDVAIFYREMVKQARKRNLGVVSITQDVEDFLHGEFGKAILTNSETKILLKQSYATLSLMGDIFPMTDDEKQQLGSLGVGEVVLFRENEHMRVDVLVLPSEQPIVFSLKS